MNYDVEVQPQQSGGEFQRYSKKRAKKNFVISQVVRENCCIFVLTLYSQPQYLNSWIVPQRYINNRAKKNFDIPQVYRKTCCIFVETTYSQPQYLSSVQNSTI